MTGDHDIRGYDIRGYNAGAMLLHWAIALAILFQLAVGFAMTRTDLLPEGLRFPVFQWHKTVGLLVLALTLARIAWRLFNPPPRPAPMPALERAAAHLVHAALYALMLAVPLSGWLLVSLSPTAIPTLLALFDRLPWPHLPVPAGWVGETGAQLAGGLHAWLAYGTAALLVLHVAGALKHGLVDRQPSLSRILPVGHLPRQSTALLAIPLAAGLAAAFLAGGVVLGRDASEAPAAASQALAAAEPTASGWVVDHAASRIGFEVPFSGQTLAGTVGAWQAAIRFDPAALAAASAEVTIDAASIAIGDPFVRSSLPGPDGLDLAAHPTIAVRLDRFTAVAAAEGRFLGEGSVTIKGRSAPVALAFTYREDPAGTAWVSGTAVLPRLAFGLGAGNDPAATYLGRDVAIRVELRAVRAPASGAS